MVHIFISYRRADSQAVVGRIYDYLENEFGDEKVFKDVDDIPPGSDFRQAINAAVEQCDVLLVVIGSSWLDIRDQHGNPRLENPNDFVRLEIEAGLQRDNVMIIPLLVQQATMPNPDVLPQSLAGLAYLNALKIRDDPDFRRDIGKLINHLKTFEIGNQGQDSEPQPLAIHRQSFLSRVLRMFRFFSRRRIFGLVIVVFLLIILINLIQSDDSPELEHTDKGVLDIIQETDDNVGLIYNNKTLSIYNASDETLNINSLQFALPDDSQKFDLEWSDTKPEFVSGWCIHISLQDNLASVPDFCDSDIQPIHELMYDRQEEEGHYWVWQSDLNPEGHFLVLYNGEILKECTVEENLCTFSVP